jgi:hypothetical protein
VNNATVAKQTPAQRPATPVEGKQPDGQPSAGRGSTTSPTTVSTPPPNDTPVPGRADPPTGERLQPGRSVPATRREAHPLAARETEPARLPTAGRRRASGSGSLRHLGPRFSPVAVDRCRVVAVQLEHLGAAPQGRSHYVVSQAASRDACTRSPDRHRRRAGHRRRHHTGSQRRAGRRGTLRHVDAAIVPESSSSPGQPRPKDAPSYPEGRAYPGANPGRTRW